MTISPRQEPFLHPQSLCESSDVGIGTRVWAFAHILPGAKIGADCNICDGVFIENDVIVGDRVTVKCGVQLWDGLRVGDDVFIGPNATFTNDRFPRSRHHPDAFLQTSLEDGASIGANATILPGVRIGRGAMVGAGAVVTRDIPPYATVVGNPAVIIGYQDNAGPLQPAAESFFAEGGLGSAIGSRLDLKVGGAWLERLPHFTDIRGSLTPLEMKKGLPFEPKRVFLVYGVPNHHVRGEHAHRECAQFLIAAHGGVSVVVDDGDHRREIRLSNPTMGLYLPPMVWGIQYKFDVESVLMVAASHAYDTADYIREYNIFRENIAR